MIGLCIRPMRRSNLTAGLALTRLALAALTLTMALTLSLGGSNGTAAQTQAPEQIGDAAAGRRLAESWCVECHAIDVKTERIGQTAPPFAAIAVRPGTTALSINVFLRSDREHRAMPNFIIQRNEAEDLAAYILGLRSPR